MTEDRAREVLAVGERFLSACWSAWSCGEPSHRVRTMLDRADEFQAAINSLAASPIPVAGKDEIERLRAALERIANYPDGNWHGDREACRNIAHAALHHPNVGDKMGEDK